MRCRAAFPFHFLLQDMSRHIMWNTPKVEVCSWLQLTQNDVKGADDGQLSFLIFDFVTRGKICLVSQHGWVNFSATSQFPLGECWLCPPRTVTPDWGLLQQSGALLEGAEIVRSCDPAVGCEERFICLSGCGGITKHGRFLDLSALVQWFYGNLMSKLKAFSLFWALKLFLRCYF